MGLLEEMGANPLTTDQFLHKYAADHIASEDCSTGVSELLESPLIALENHLIHLKRGFVSNLNTLSRRTVFMC